MSDAGNREQYPYHRRFVRHRVRLKVHVHSGQHFTAWTANVSEDGLSFEIPAFLPSGDEVDVWVYVSRAKKEEPPVETTCRIVWADRGKKGTRHGAQFTSFAADGKERLAAWLVHA
ncbi:MAG: PilZ domain-containing protein [Deltaproteobacteria bacterium]|nr:PilZ domain-containing protein [Deltaproteobacteria bacterium]